MVVNPIESPAVTARSVGLTAIRLGTAGSLTSASEPVAPPQIAETVTAPAPKAVKRPGAPSPPASVATVSSELDQSASAVTSRWLPSEKLATAASWRAPQGAMRVKPGETTIERSAARMVTVAAPLIGPSVAVMVAVPGPVAISLPWPASMAATAWSEELQVTRSVSSAVVPSSSVPVADSACAAPSGIMAAPMRTSMRTSVGVAAPATGGGAAGCMGRVPPQPIVDAAPAHRTTRRKTDER